MNNEQNQQPTSGQQPAQQPYQAPQGYQPPVQPAQQPYQAPQGYRPPVQPTQQPYQAPQGYQPPVQPMQQPYQQAYQQPYQQPMYAPQPQAPEHKLSTDRSLVKYILLSLITCGIYGVVQLCILSVDINVVAGRYDGKKTMFYLLACLLGIVTCGIYPIVWFAMLASRMNNELKRRGLPETIKLNDFWIWYILGSLFFVGPFIFLHKLLSSMNKLAADYNVRG